MGSQLYQVHLRRKSCTRWKAGGREEGRKTSGVQKATAAAGACVHYLWVMCDDIGETPGCLGRKWAPCVIAERHISAITSRGCAIDVHCAEGPVWSHRVPQYDMIPHTCTVSNVKSRLPRLYTGAQATFDCPNPIDVRFGKQHTDRI